MEFRNIFIFFLAIGSLLLWTGCEEEIVIDVETHEPIVVIEGLVTDAPGPYEIKVSWSMQFFEEKEFDGISGAEVLLWDDQGNSDSLVEVEPGIYHTTTFQGQMFDTYFLRVIVEGEVYEAQSTMHRLNPIDSLAWTYYPDLGIPFFEEGWYVTFYAPESPGKGDYYKMKFYVNDSLYAGAGDLNVFEDRFSDGQYAVWPLFYEVEPTDTVKVEVLSISEEAYIFYNTLLQELFSAGNPFGAPPANVKGNLSNNALGLFEVSAVSGKELVIPEE